LQRLLDEADDPRSLLWKGHLEHGAFVKAELQYDAGMPGHPVQSKSAMMQGDGEGYRDGEGKGAKGKDGEIDERAGGVWQGKLAGNIVCQKLFRLLEM
jgi:hypothetical protein